MKANYLMASMAVAAVLSACTKTMVVNDKPEVPSEGQGPVAVEFGVGEPSVAVETKGSGAVGGLENSNNWNGETLYVMGFDNSLESYTNPETAAFIWNVSAAAPATGASGAINVYDKNASGTYEESGTDPFYYEDGVVYNFYGYHIDDAFEGAQEPDAAPAPAASAAGDYIYVPFVIDGSQDLMVGATDPDADKQAATEPGAADVTVANIYSSYAARRGIQPTLKFTHLLSQFQFKVIAGSESGKKVNVTSVSLVSQTKGNMVVASKNAEVPVGIRDTTDKAELTLALTPSVAPADDAASLTGCILAIPTSKYQMTVTLESGTDSGSGDEPYYPGTIEPVKAEVALTDAEFEAGKIYTVTIKVNGPEDVQVSASLAPWQTGDDIEIDTDKPVVPAENDEGN